MVLKDIKNDPDVSTGLHSSLVLSKRRMSDSACKSPLPHKSKIRKGIDDCFSSSKSEHNIMNTCSDLRNSLAVGSVALQNKEGNKSGYYKAESSKHEELKNSDGMVQPVTAKGSAPPLPRDIGLSAPEHHSASKLLGISTMSLSYFADPTVRNENEEPEFVELTSSNGNKYFSTPMVSKIVKKKLTPVMELDIESCTSEDWRSHDKISSTDIVHKNSYAADVPTHESPTQTPLYRSFFAAECQEIVNQIEGIETVVKSPVKRKADALDVSSIDAEPPPYECTPMKSMLACEVANMMRSLDSSPIGEGVSLFGESLLDLEKVDMQLHDFNLSECSKGQSLSDSANDGILYLSDGLSRGCSKRQKTEQLSTNESKTHSVSRTEMMEPSAKMVDNVTSVILHQFDNKGACDIESKSDCANNISGSINTTQNMKSRSEGIIPLGTTQVMKVEHNHSDNIIEQVVLMQDEAIAMNICQATDPSPKDLVNTTQNIVSVHEMSTASPTWLIETDVHKQCASTTQDILIIHDELHPSNTNQVIPINLTQNTSIHKEVTTVNMTHVIELIPQTPNITRDISFMHEECSIANTTQVIELVPQSSANTTHDISSMHDEVITDTTQEVEVVQNTSVNTKMEFSAVDEVTEATVPQTIDAVPNNNATQDGAPLIDEVIVANAQLFITAPQTSSNTMLDMTGKCDIVIGDLPSIDASEHLSKDMQLLTDVSESSQNLILSPEEVFVPLSMSPSENLVTEKKDASILNDHENVPPHSLFNPQETLFSNNKANLVPVPESVEDQLVVDITCRTTDHGKLVCTLAQSKSDATEGELSKATEEKCNRSSAEKVSLQNEVDTCKESNSPLLSESYSMIQEEECAHDVSVFSAGSLSFVTSTPVPGFNNFQFQKTCYDSVHHEPNVSLGSVLEESTNKVPVEQRITTQPLGMQGLNDNNKVKKISRGSMLPTCTERGIRPPSGLIPRQIAPTSGIPSARRSLALFNNTTGQNPGKEPTLSKMVPRGIPGTGIIRPPLVRQSLPRVGPGILKQSTEETGGSTMANKLKGSRFRIPKAASAKTRSTAAHSQLPNAPSLVKPPSRLCAPNSGRHSVGVQNATNNLQDPQCGAINSVRPLISAEVRTSLPKPGSSSIRPPLQLHPQKVSPKLKSNLTGLLVKKTLPALGPRRDIGSTKGESTSETSSTKQSISSAANFVNEAASFDSLVKSSSSSSHIQHTTAENQEKLHSSISSIEECASLPATTSEQAESEVCLHLETCKCCNTKYRQLLQELEDLKRRLGQSTSCKT
ncbi:uncharacterized protein LOC142100726 isoform X2 [Mixophyes fleayi]|uniref:uncharacterized protein LOC142100726 isoform X2 n=1 Tax=Mixophyes fleayi TaxID=3061075 RepID=UPI003F4E1399